MRSCYKNYEDFIFFKDAFEGMWLSDPTPLKAKSLKILLKGLSIENRRYWNDNKEMLLKIMAEKETEQRTEVKRYQKAKRNGRLDEYYLGFDSS